MFVRTQYDPTSGFPAMAYLNTSTLRTSATIASVSASRSGWINATRSLQAIQFPRADSLSLTIYILTPSGNSALSTAISSSVVEVGTSNPFLLPAVILPMISMPPMVISIIGIESPNVDLTVFLNTSVPGAIKQ
jgi:hypothetical protein